MISFKLSLILKPNIIIGNSTPKPTKKNHSFEFLTSISKNELHYQKRKHEISTTQPDYHYTKSHGWNSLNKLMIRVWVNKSGTMESYIPQRTTFMVKSWISWMNACNFEHFLPFNLLSKTLNTLEINRMILSTWDPNLDYFVFRLSGVRKVLKYPSIVWSEIPYLVWLYSNIISPLYKHEV